MDPRELDELIDDMSREVEGGPSWTFLEGTGWGTQDMPTADLLRALKLLRLERQHGAWFAMSEDGEDLGAMDVRSSTAIVTRVALDGSSGEVELSVLMPPQEALHEFLIRHMLPAGDDGAIYLRLTRVLYKGLLSSPESVRGIAPGDL